MIRLTLGTEQEECGRWLAEVPEIAGCMVYGPTEEESIRAAQALAIRVLTDRVAHGELNGFSLDGVRFERVEPGALQAPQR